MPYNSRNFFLLKQKGGKLIGFIARQSREVFANWIGGLSDMRVTLPDVHMPLTTRVIASILNGWGTFKWKLPVRAPPIVPSCPPGPDGRTWRTLKRWKHQPDELKHPICDSIHGEICKDGSTLWLYCSQRPRLSEFIQQLWQVLSSYLICKKWANLKFLH